MHPRLPVLKLQSTYPIVDAPFSLAQWGTPRPISIHRAWVTREPRVCSFVRSFIPRSLRLHSTKISSHSVPAPPPGHRKDPQPHARDLHHNWASAARRKTPGPRQGEPRGNGLSRKQEPGPGGWAGRPFPTAVRFLPLPASSVRHPGGAQSPGVSRWGRATARYPHATSGAAPRPRLSALGGRGGVKLLQGPARAGREGESPVEEARRGVQGRGGGGAAGHWAAALRAGGSRSRSEAGGRERTLLARARQGSGSALRVPRGSESSTVGGSESVTWV